MSISPYLNESIIIGQSSIFVATNFVHFVLNFFYNESYLGINKELQEQKLKSAPRTNLKPPPSDIVVAEKVYGKNASLRRPKVPITATSYTVAALQIATSNFSQENLVGEGSLGRVYKAEFSNGKVGNT